MYKWLALFAASVLGAHALAYYIVAALPEPSVVLLGLFSGNTEALAAVRARTELAPYDRVLADLVSGNLGRTLDNVSVAVELLRAVQNSAPRFLSILAIVALVTRHGASRAGEEVAQGARVAEFLAFVPAFVFPLALLGLLQAVSYLSGRSLDYGALSSLFCVASAAIGPAALVYLQSRAVMQALLESQYAVYLLALGAPRGEVQKRVSRNFYAELLPSFAKLVVSVLGFLMFAEFIFDLPGIGKLAFLAITRSDFMLILGVVLAFSLIVNLGNVVALATQRRLLGGQ